MQTPLAASLAILQLFVVSSIAVAKGADSWLLQDPDFPVQVSVGPFGDSSVGWNREYDNGTLHIPSSVLNITVVLPPLVNVSSAQVSLTLFRASQVDETGTPQSDHHVLADSQVAYARSYRMDLGTNAQRVILRVYVEATAHLESGRDMKKRSFFIRELDLSPSDARVMQCPTASQDEDSDTEIQVHSLPPTDLPDELCAEYTKNGAVPVRKWYFDDKSDADRSYQERSFEYIEELIQNAHLRREYYYGLTDRYLYAALDLHPIKGKDVLIMGSTIPWYESICVAFEAASCTTVDYNKLRYHHASIRTYTVTEFSAMNKKYDVILSISSFEHDGLGRYGDPLDPDADVKAMKNLLQYAKPDTKLFLAVPVGPDAVIWNAERIYGPIRLPLLLESWRLVDSYGFREADFTASFTLGHQPIFVLTPPEVSSQQKEPHAEL